MSHVTIGTANSYLGKMLKDPEGLKAFADTDILLLQEVDPVAEQIEKLIAETDFRLAQISVGVGLAILHRETVEPVPNLSDGLTLLQATPTYQRRILQKFREHPLQTVGRGTLQARFRTVDDQELTAVTGHANVPLKPIRRAKYVAMLADVMATVQGPAVLAGDMNHWPGPQAVDHEMVSRAKLERVALDRPTYTSLNSQHRWMGRLGINIEGEFDAMMYTPQHLEAVKSEVRDISSDHRAIVTQFNFF
nr:endonuclease/exonuclease/phosphatase family protein [Nitrosomonas nitrosa]